MARTEADLAKSDIYADIIASYFKDPNLVKQFFDVERDLYDLVESGDLSTKWATRFNALNRNTESYAERNIRPDVRCLTKAPERLREIANPNQGVIALASLVTGVVVARGRRRSVPFCAASSNL